MDYHKSEIQLFKTQLKTVDPIGLKSLYSKRITYIVDIVNNLRPAPQRVSYIKIDPSNNRYFRPDDKVYAPIYDELVDMGAQGPVIVHDIAMSY